MNTTDKNPTHAPDTETLMEFPCQFSVKAMGKVADDFDALVFAIVKEHVENLPEGCVTNRISAKGNYQSVTVTFEASSKQQLDNIYYALTDHERVMIAL